MRLILCAALLAVSLPASADVISSVAALVNDDIITSYEIRKEMQPLEKEAEKKAIPLASADRERLYRETLNRLVDKKLVDQKIRELNIRIGEEELRQAIDD